MVIICPICRKKTTWKENPCRPFCSERCKLVDLGKWVSEEYRIKGKEDSEKQTEEKRQQIVDSRQETDGEKSGR
jgi:endogenous inhibitor of DNA gyrase (YacG/DUF329 family)